MEINIYAAFDCKAECYGTPFFMANDPLAVRAFTNASLNEETTLSMNPEDFRLMRLGSFDDSSGALTSHDNPVFVCSALECVTAAHAASNKKILNMEKGEPHEDS